MSRHYATCFICFNFICSSEQHHETDALLFLLDRKNLEVSKSPNDSSENLKGLVSDRASVLDVKPHVFKPGLSDIVLPFNFGPERGE